MRAPPWLRLLPSTSVQPLPKPTPVASAPADTMGRVEDGAGSVDLPADRRGRSDRTTLATLLVLCALPMLALAWVRLLLHFPAGDEPHYLIISEALARYHSLDVQRVYDNRDYAGFFPLPIDPHTAPGPSGRSLPLHSIGGPVLWLVPFVLWGRAGVLAFMVGVSSLVVANVYWLS